MTRPFAAILAVGIGIAIWFVSYPRIGLIPRGPLTLAKTLDGPELTLPSRMNGESVSGYPVLGCSDNKSRIYPRIELTDGSSWIVVGGDYLLRRDPLWRMGLRYYRIAFG